MELDDTVTHQELLIADTRRLIQHSKTLRQRARDIVGNARALRKVSGFATWPDGPSLDGDALASPARLFHVCDRSGIDRFEPRPSARAHDPVVWAIDDERLRNYLLPRDCPRVTYSAAGDATHADVARFLGAAEAVVAVESQWL